ncbi:MAG: DUF1566 domain-containing protein [Euryarchaeota archaeon]|nr:DUF1566 domain-containing protein [Euryarchaeota archaeon]
MNLKLQYIKLVLVIMALLACFCFNAYAQSSTTIGKDTVVVTIKDENNNSVSFYLPESMNNDQCERRIYGTRTGVIGMFKTLYSEERRTESYEAAIRELCIQPGASQSYIGHLEKSLQSAGVASEDANFVLDLVKYGADSINKKYIKGGTLTADAHNRLAKVGRKLNAAQKSPAFAQACIAFENVKATAKLTETITGAFLLNSLSTDQAWIRLKEIERAVDSERQAQGKVDPALKEAIEQSEINLLAAQSKIGAFAVSVNDKLQEITDSAISLGATLADISAKLSAPVAMWVGAPLMTYNTLQGISNQWEMAQDGVSLATVTKMVEKYSEGRETITDNITSYGQYAFYSQMENTFSVDGAKFHDFLSPGSANKDWSQYYKQRKQNTIIIAIKDTNSQEGTIQEEKTLKKTYALRDIGPAGGYIFYDKGSYSDGWRYLEAAPASTEWTPKHWGVYGTLIGGTETGIGTGQSNTTTIVTWLNSHSEKGFAAQVCDTLVVENNGVVYSDWFLPSIDELNLMHVNLGCFGVGGFTGHYWSSSEDSNDLAWSQLFYCEVTSDTQAYSLKDDRDNRVRAVRSF